MSSLDVDGVTVRFDGSLILTDLTFALTDGEVVAVLGPSGSGKSTLLRAIAGLVPSSGTIHLGGRRIDGLPTHRRGVGLMFQDHALFPHLDVAANIAFGLREARWPAGAIERRVRELLTLVELDGFERRPVQSLSGGEAQRVALARSLAPSPRLLMLDEPLGSLDRRLRDELGAELHGLLRRTQTTSLFVTHDQEEAALVADRLLVLDGGRLVADGPPQDLWARPPTPALARFLGHRNLSDEAMIPPTAVAVTADLAADGYPGTVGECRFVDGVWRLAVELAAPVRGIARLNTESPVPLAVGTSVRCQIDGRDIHSFPRPVHRALPPADASGA